MAVVIRLKPTGKKGERKFRIVVQEKRSKRDGRAIETLGWFEKGPKGQKNVNKERYSYWMSHGAQPSNTVAKITAS
ncbi:MAG: 30S ribosomal protein S16 [Candidatus Levybacteria bacterium]|nr:30S ribosomal protein S16 [Candidatus Levybacteria bacterium]